MAWNGEPSRLSEIWLEYEVERTGKSPSDILDEAWKQLVNLKVNPKPKKVKKVPAFDPVFSSY